MAIDEMIAVLQAARNGKRIQYRVKGEDRDAWRDSWVNEAEPLSDWKPDFGAWSYRVKPEPREWWIRTKQQSQEQFAWNRDEILTEQPHNPNFIHVREVLP